jgi:hypothetical protein
MFAELVRSRPGGSGALPATSTPDAAFAARTRLRALRDALQHARARAARSPWLEPPLFFFDGQRQRDLIASRPAIETICDPLHERLAREMAALCGSVEVRQAARAVTGLRDAAAALPFAQPLAELLAVPDDETVLVIHPRRRLGYRFTVRGIATVNQFHLLMLPAIEESLPTRFVAACRDANPSIPAGVPMLAELPFQCFRPAGVQSDGSVPAGFSGVDHWLWGWEPLAAAPRIDGERVILLGDPAYPQTWDVERKYPAMAASAELQDVLSPFQVAERLSRIAGRTVPVQLPHVRQAALAAAA